MEDGANLLGVVQRASELEIVGDRLRRRAGFTDDVVAHPALEHPNLEVALDRNDRRHDDGDEDD